MKSKQNTDMEETLTKEDLIKFFEDRPALKPRAVSVEADYSDSFLGKIVRGDRTLTEEVSKRIYPVLYKYGYGR
jgi:hypothetical protein